MVFKIAKKHAMAKYLLELSMVDYDLMSFMVGISRELEIKKITFSPLFSLPVLSIFQ